MNDEIPSDSAKERQRLRTAKMHELIDRIGNIIAAKEKYTHLRGTNAVIRYLCDKRQWTPAQVRTLSARDVIILLDGLGFLEREQKERQSVSDQYHLNILHMLYHLRDAQSALSEAIDYVEAAKDAGNALDRDEAEEEEKECERLFHAVYCSMNRAWNGRKSTPEQAAKCTSEYFDLWNHFPRDIELE